MSTSPEPVAARVGRGTTVLRYEAAAPAGGTIPGFVPDLLGHARLVLAHGAGAGQGSPFMTTWARALAALGVEVVTFDFPYMAEGRRLPDRAPVLEACYREVVEASHAAEPARKLFIGGKSMGGRMATHIAAADRALPVAGLVLLGYPLHPPGRPETRRDRHLPDVRRPMLFVQGERDTFGTPEELEPVLAPLAPPARLHVVPRADHSFKLSRAAPGEQAAVHAALQRAIVEWMRSVG